MTDFLPQNFTSSRNEADQFSKYYKLLTLRKDLVLDAERRLNSFVDVYNGKVAVPSTLVEGSSKLLADEGNQRALAIRNASSVMAPADANQFVRNYLTSLPELNLFNQTFDNFKTTSLAGFNMITPTLMNSRWESYQNSLKGVKISTTSTSVGTQTEMPSTTTRETQTPIPSRASWRTQTTPITTASFGTQTQAPPTTRTVGTFSRPATRTMYTQVQPIGRTIYTQVRPTTRTFGTQTTPRQRITPIAESPAQNAFEREFAPPRSRLNPLATPFYPRRIDRSDDSGAVSLTPFDGATISSSRMPDEIRPDLPTPPPPPADLVQVATLLRQSPSYNVFASVWNRPQNQRLRSRFSFNSPFTVLGTLLRAQGYTGRLSSASVNTPAQRFASAKMYAL
jgi:hypothetical protein